MCDRLSVDSKDFVDGTDAMFTVAVTKQAEACQQLGCEHCRRL